MRSSLFIISLSVIAGSANAQRQWPQCIQSCITSDPVLDQCDGDETGADLDKCTCASFVGSNLIKCIKDCPKDQQSEYASVLPDSCRSQLLPGVTATTGGGTPTTTDATTTGQATETTGGNGSADDHSSTEGSGSEKTSTDAAAAQAIPTMFAAAGILVGLAL